VVRSPRTNLAQTEHRETAFPILRPAKFPMVISRVPFAAFVLAAALLASPSAGHAAFPDYKIGDIATEDVITPRPLSVTNAEVTETLQQNAANEVPFVVRFNPKGPDEAEVALRAAIIMARYKFMRIFQDQLLGRTPTEADVGSPAFTRAIAEVARDAPKDFPYDQLTPLWINGVNEETFVLTLAQPIRAAMAQIIVDPRMENQLPANRPLRLVTVKNLSMPPGTRALDGPGLIVSQSKIISLSYARQLVENNFANGHQKLGRFASAFLRPNAQPDAAATEILKNNTVQSVVANDTYAAAQIVVRKGQIIDRKALNALAALRKESAARPAITQAESARPRPTPTRFSFAHLQDSDNAVRIAVVAGSAIFLTFLGIFWSRRARRNTTRPPARSRRRRTIESESVILIEETATSPWEDRARVAEAKVERAHQAIRTGTLAWMKDKFVNTLFRHRAELLAVQQKAQAEIEQLERRLEQLHVPLQQRIQAYEKRIAELEAKLASKGEENRRLLGASISLTRQHLQAERQRVESN
jgi:hypothetical protein